MMTAKEAGFTTVNTPLPEPGWRWLAKGDVIEINDEWWDCGVGPWMIVTITNQTLGMKVTPASFFPVRRRLAVVLKAETVTCIGCNRNADASVACWWCGASN